MKNGTRKDGTQRFLCRDCKKSFLPTSESVTSRTRKNLSVWTLYLKCMLDKKTLRETSEECGISMSTAFSWRHKILDALHEMNGKVFLDGTVEADETFSQQAEGVPEEIPRCFHEISGELSGPE